MVVEETGSLAGSMRLIPLGHSLKLDVVVLSLAKSETMSWSHLFSLEAWREAAREQEEGKNCLPSGGDIMTVSLTLHEQTLTRKSSIPIPIQHNVVVGFLELGTVCGGGNQAGTTSIGRLCVCVLLWLSTESKGCMWETVRFTRKMDKELKMFVQRSNQLGVPQGCNTETLSWNMSPQKSPAGVLITWVWVQGSKYKKKIYKHHSCLISCVWCKQTAKQTHSQ